MQVFQIFYMLGNFHTQMLRTDKPDQTVQNTLQMLTRSILCPENHLKN